MVLASCAIPSPRPASEQPAGSRLQHPAMEKIEREHHERGRPHVRGDDVGVADQGRIEGEEGERHDPGRRAVEVPRPEVDDHPHQQPEEDDRQPAEQEEAIEDRPVPLHEVGAEEPGVPGALAGGLDRADLRIERQQRHRRQRLDQRRRAGGEVEVAGLQVEVADREMGELVDGGGVPDQTVQAEDGEGAEEEESERGGGGPGCRCSWRPRALPTPSRTADCPCPPPAPAGRGSC